MMLKINVANLSNNLLFFYCCCQQEDHAICCVEMGLSMIDTMRIFDSERHEGIKMRVGIHTGKKFLTLIKKYFFVLLI